MQHSAQNGSGRREERVPLETLIELRTDDKAERIEADGLDVSIGGVGMRATFLPELGSLFECRFHCPPEGELVCAQGRVMWTDARGPRDARFGLHFIGLDTKSGATLRRYLAPHGVMEAPVDRLRAATLLIDGLGTPIEAELKLADETRIVLEQQLAFLQLGRGVEVSVLGRGQERGRIASIELRHTHFDVPTLVFGILLDDARTGDKRPVEQVSARVAPLFGSKPQPAKPSTSPAAANASAAARTPTRTTTLRGAPPPRVPAQLLAESASDSQSELVEDLNASEPASHAQLDPPSRERLLTSTSSGLRPLEVLPDDLPTIEPAESTRASIPSERTQTSGPPEGYDFRDDDPYALTSDDADHEIVDDAEVEAERLEIAHPIASRVRSLSEQARVLSQVLRERVTNGVSNVRQRIEPALREQAETFDLPDAKTRFLLQIARMRAFFVGLWARATGGARSVRRAGERRAPQRLRVQRSTLPGVGTHEEERVDTGQRTRIAAALLAAAGIGLGVYVLAPRSGGADRIQVPDRVEQAQQEAATGLEGEASGDPTGEPEHEEGDVAAPTPSAEEPALDLEVEQAAAAESPSGRGGSTVVGDPEVPNGRTFLLSMNGPVHGLEAGRPREDGFTVRILGRRAGDPAAPIATQHKAVARAMILNRSGYAELTIDFVPGVKPRYQVRGKGDAIEITIERVGP